MHEAEIKDVIVRALRNSLASPPAIPPSEANEIDDLAIDIMVGLQLAGFEIKKRGRQWS